MRFRFIPNEILAARSFGGVSNSRDPPFWRSSTNGARWRVAQWSMAAGFVLHTATLIADWALDGHYPLFSLRETLSFLAWALVGGYAIVLYRYRAQAVGAFTMPLICVLTFVALLITGDSGTSVEAFSTTWLFPIHTTLLVFAYAAFFIVFMASFVLAPERELKLKTFSAFFHRLPSLSTINEIATHAAAIGLTLLTLGLVAGMFWNWSLHGTMWRNDPKRSLRCLRGCSTSCSQFIVPPQTGADVEQRGSAYSGSCSCFALFWPRHCSAVITCSVWH